MKSQKFVKYIRNIFSEHKNLSERRDDKVAVATGSGRGIGGAMARGFAKEGANVVLISRTMSQLKDQEAWIRANTPASVLTIEADVGNESECTTNRR